MKRLFFIIVLGMLALSASDDPRNAYISKYSALAVSEMKRTGVPASITLAQGILESGAGLSELSLKANNHFGIKCHRDWTGEKVYHQAETGKECFRVYRTVEESFRDHSDFIRYQDRYKFLFNLEKGDYRGWAVGLGKAGYATDPGYPEKLIKIIEDYGLCRYDGGEVDVESPLALETPVKADEADAAEETVRVSLGRIVYKMNGVPFIYAVEGESYGSIARANNLFRKELLGFNDLSEDVRLDGGERVYLAAKKKMAAKGIDKYIVGDGESVTLRDVAQRFGVRLSSLERMNGSAGKDTFEEGETIILRK